MTMQGFFSVEEVASKTRPEGKKLSCVSCGRKLKCKNPCLTPWGDNEKRVMNIFSYPNLAQDRAGEGDAGGSWSFLHHRMAYQKLLIPKDCINIFAVRCYDKKYPTYAQIESCRASVFAEIKRYKPQLIFLHGYVAVQSVIGALWKNSLGPLSRWVGWCIPDQTLEAWICPLFSPEEILDAKDVIHQTVWEQYMKKAVNKLDVVFPVAPGIAQTAICTTEKESIACLRRILASNSRYVAFDYETTGLKPHRHGHEIKCVSFAYTEKEHISSWSLPLPKSEKGLRLFKEVLTNNSIGKIAHNMRMEQSWTKNLLGYDVNPWVWDSMQAAHILDTRPNTCGLKFQTYVNFGVAGYDDGMTPYLRAMDEKDSNSLNRINEAWAIPERRRDILQYNAYDSLYTYYLASLQERQMMKELA